jgi:hypothetical protein
LPARAPGTVKARRRAGHTAGDAQLIAAIVSLAARVVRTGACAAAADAGLARCCAASLEWPRCVCCAVLPRAPLLLRPCRTLCAGLLRAGAHVPCLHTTSLDVRSADPPRPEERATLRAVTPGVSVSRKVPLGHRKPRRRRMDGAVPFPRRHAALCLMPRWHNGRPDCQSCRAAAVSASLARRTHALGCQCGPVILGRKSQGSKRARALCYRPLLASWLRAPVAMMHPCIASAAQEILRGIAGARRAPGGMLSPYHSVTGCLPAPTRTSPCTCLPHALRVSATLGIASEAQHGCFRGLLPRTLQCFRRKLRAARSVIEHFPCS